MSRTEPSPLAEEDYEAIEGAVMETSRGRWFLSEYARRHRNADTTAVLGAIERLERIVRRDRSLEVQDELRAELVGMKRVLERLHADLATSGGNDRGLAEAGADLDAVVSATERATQDILSAAERVQEVAWVLREQGVDSAHCDALDERATEIYLACSFQDVTGQRIRRVVEALRGVEARVNAAMDAAGLGGPAPRESPAPEVTVQAAPVHEDAHLLNGPAMPGEGIDQTAVDDLMLESVETAVAPTPAPDDDILAPLPAPEPELAAAVVPPPPDPIVVTPLPVPQRAPTPRTYGALALAEPEPIPEPAPVPRHRIDMSELSPVEKLALFS